MPKKINDREVKHNSSRRVVVFAWCFIAISLFFAALNGIEIIYQRFNPDPPAVRLQKLGKDPLSITKHLRINGVDYDIPVGYFRWRVPYSTEDVNTALAFMYPNFLPLDKTESALFKEKKKEYVIGDLINDPQIMMPLDDFSETILNKITRRNTITSHEYDLEIYDPEEERGSGRQVPHIARNKDGSVLALITCSEKFVNGSRRPGNPQCSHYFSDGSLRHQLSYSKKRLPQWKALQERTTAMFAEFRERANQKGLDKSVVPPDRVSEQVIELRNRKQESQEKKQ